MSNKFNLIAAALCLFVLGACASMEDAGADQAAESDVYADADDGERVYVTGSIIPRKVRPGDVKTADPNEIRGALIRQSNTGAAGGG